MHWIDFRPTLSSTLAAVTGGHVAGYALVDQPELQRLFHDIRHPYRHRMTVSCGRPHLGMKDADLGKSDDPLSFGVNDDLPIFLHERTDIGVFQYIEHDLGWTA